MNKNFFHKVGAHLSIKNSILNVFKEAVDLEIAVFACFTNSTLQYGIEKVIKEDLAIEFKKKMELENFLGFSHACYLTNIANKEKLENYKKSIRSIASELKRCDQLGLSGAVVHPGSNINRELGLNTIVESIEEIFNLYLPKKTLLLLESSAGQGNTLPTTLEELRFIFDRLSKKSFDKCKVTIDTCHVHAAGYDLSKKNLVLDFLMKLEDVLGFDFIKLFHINDSKGKACSKIDRHQNIGKGTIGLDGFSALINYEKVISIPKILETPVSTYLDWKEDLKILESIIK